MLRHCNVTECLCPIDSSTVSLLCSQSSRWEHFPLAGGIKLYIHLSSPFIAAVAKENRKIRGGRERKLCPRLIEIVFLFVFCFSLTSTSPSREERFAFGHHYFRPHETHHSPSRKFYHNELFRVPLYEIIPLEAVVGTCCVLDLYTYCKGKETGSEITFGSCVEMVPAAQRQQAASRCCLWHQGCDLCCAGGEEAAAGRCCGKGGKVRAAKAVCVNLGKRLM